MMNPILKKQWNQPISLYSTYFSLLLFPSYFIFLFCIDFIRTNLLKINSVFAGRQLKVNLTHTNFLATFLTILKLL